MPLGTPISRRRMLGTVGAGGLGLMGAALIGCSAGQNKPAAAPAASNQAAGGSGAAAAPKPGGIFRTVIVNEPTNIDIVAEVSANVAAAHNPVYSRLLRYKTGPGVVPGS